MEQNQVIENHNQQIDNEIQRNSSIQHWDKDYIEEQDQVIEADPKWYNDIEIMFPKQKSGFFKSYLVYEVVFKIDNDKKRVFRRFKDFATLRNVLRKYLPGIYIYPAHKKQIHLKRKIELQKFLNYLTKNRPIFDCEPLEVFFNTNIEETECGDKLSKLDCPKISSIFQKYQNIFFDLQIQEPEQRQIDQINYFGDKMQTNVEFFQVIQKASLKYKQRFFLQQNIVL